MGGRGQGVRRGRSDVRGRVQNGRYDKVRTGNAAGTPLGNRWQVLDQTGDDMDLSIEEVRRERREEIREETVGRENYRERDDMVGELRRISQPGTSVRAERTAEGGRSATGDDNEGQAGIDKDGDKGMAARKRNLQERSPG
jgi:hypothetical protein